MKKSDSFSAGDVLCSIETDKATIDFEAQDHGVLARILREGPTTQDIAVGMPNCVIIEDVADVGAFVEFVKADEAPPADAPAAVAPVAAENPAVASAAAAQDRSVAGEFVIFPSARHLSQSKGVDATGLSGSGKGGRVTKGDVLEAFANGTHMPPFSTTADASTEAPAVAAPAAPVAAAPQTVSLQALVDLPPPAIEAQGSFKDVINNNMRKIIARRLTESNSQVPHYYVSMEIDLDNILALRKTLVNNHNVKISVNDLIIRSSALAL